MTCHSLSLNSAPYTPKTSPHSLNFVHLKAIIKGRILRGGLMKKKKKKNEFGFSVGLMAVG